MSFTLSGEPIESHEMDESLIPSAAIADCLREARIKLRLTREALSEQVGVTAKSIQRYEEARQIPRVKTLEKLGRVLNIPLDAFFREREMQSPKRRTRSAFDELAAGQREILSRLAELELTAGQQIILARMDSLAVSVERLTALMESLLSRTD